MVAQEWPGHTYIQTDRQTHVLTIRTIRTTHTHIYIFESFSPRLSLSLFSLCIRVTNRIKQTEMQIQATPGRSAAQGRSASVKSSCCVNLVPALCGLYPRHPIRRSFRDFSTFVEVITPWKLSELSSCKGQWLGSKVKGTSNGKRRSFQWGQGDGDCFGMIFAPGSCWKMGVASSLTKISLLRSCSNWFLTVINGQYGL